MAGTQKDFMVELLIPKGFNGADDGKAIVVVKASLTGISVKN